MRKRYKLLLIIFISFIFVIIIYKYFHQESYMYLAIGSNLNNNLSTYNYLDYLNKNLDKENYIFKHYDEIYLTSDSLLENISKDNGDINYYLKNANLITISLDTEELYNYENLNNDIILDYLTNVYSILNSIIKINNGKIVLINLYNDDLNTVNVKLKRYCHNNDIIYIGKENLTSSVYLINNKSYLSYQGHKELATIINN